ncbi:hypothetical protein [Pseudooceanicola marinus]|uniref:hypothetical protein n=2 Tax=Pseudooceanicola marinus TaxID=396013 RepID=UPI001CD1F063|nr:hypothetical protein [Pseudooceanicola marinus]MCA1338267.1 hypothetical protein [Pseudooceanicola marinus]
MTLFQKFTGMRRFVLILGLALLCLVPVLGAALQPSGLSAHTLPASAETTTRLPGPSESR